MDEQFLPSEGLRLSADELRPLLRRRDGRALLAVLRVAGQAVLVVAVAAQLPPVWHLLSWPLIGATQHAISILQHEAVHGLLFRSRRVNDAVGALLSYPIGFSMGYRAVHFAHHRYLGTDRDPDMANYGPFPSTKRALLMKVVLEFSGISAVRQFLSGGSAAGSGRSLPALVLTHAGLLLIFTVTVGPWAYLTLWVLPLLTCAKGFTQIRNLTEHFLRRQAAAGTERAHTFRSHPVERFFLAPLHFHHHAEHHWYPMVPFYHLPALRLLLQVRPAYAAATSVDAGYLSVLAAAYRQSA